MNDKQKSLKKLQDEIAKEKHPYVQVVGDFLIKHLKNHPEAADKILDDNKTILKSLEEMKKVAMEQKVGDCAVLTDEQGFAVVLDYFGLEQKAVERKPKTRTKEDDLQLQQLTLEI